MMAIPNATSSKASACCLLEFRHSGRRYHSRIVAVVRHGAASDIFILHHISPRSQSKRHPELGVMDIDEGVAILNVRTQKQKSAGYETAKSRFPASRI